jgi:hypothetical protein
MCLLKATLWEVSISGRTVNHVSPRVTDNDFGLLRPQQRRMMIMLVSLSRKLVMSEEAVNQNQSRWRKVRLR